jgi:membrane-associated protein
VIIGFGISYLALGAFLAAVILTGQLMANYLSNAGGAWDNAKKYIEDGHEGGKGSEAHKAAVIVDTVGDPFKDTAGPALNPLIKVMNLVSLLTLPAIISLRDNDGARFTIAGVGLLILIERSLIRSVLPPAWAHRRRRQASIRQRLTARHGARLASAIMFASVLALGGFLDPQKLLEHGSLLLLAIIFAESGLLIGFFLPGDSLLFVGGFLSSASGGHRLPNLAIVLPLLFVAAVAGDQVGYAFGNHAGPALFRRPDSRFFKQQHLQKAHVFFDRYGPKTILLARFVPIVRTFAPIVAGAGSMKYRTFVIYNLVGAFVWTVGVTTLGYYLGQVKFISDHVDLIVVAAVVIVVAFSAVPATLHWRERRRAKAAGRGGLSRAAAVRRREYVPIVRAQRAAPKRRRNVRSGRHHRRQPSPVTTCSRAMATPSMSRRTVPDRRCWSTSRLRQS